MSTYYFVPSRNVFGEGSVVETGELMKSLGGSKAMIVTDEFLASHPMTARIQKILKDAGVDSAVFGKAEPNPKDTNVVEGEKFYHDNGCDCILSLGGGGMNKVNLPDGTLRRFHNPKFPEQYIELLPGVLEQKQALFRLMADGAK